MVCFCDIPIKQSYSQRKKFGKYGIALKKDWAISNWITPVTYVAENTKNHSILFSIFALVENALRFHRSDEFKNDDNPYLIALQNRIQNYMDYVKPYFNFRDNRKYYDEKEWRYIPDNFSELDREDTKKYLKFQLNDISNYCYKCHREKNCFKNLREKYTSISKSIITIRHG